MNDLSTWARVLIYGAGAVASAVLLYAVVYLAVRAALRSSQVERQQAAASQEELLRAIATSAEYVADVADAWAEAEAARRAPAGGNDATETSSSTQGKDHASTGESSD